MQQYPRVGVGVVVFKDNKVLLVQRGQEPNKGSWSIPGGKQELGEVLIETARREVGEETGILIDEPQLLETLDMIERDPTGNILYHYTLIDFMANWMAGDVQAGDDAVQAIWVDVDDLSSYKLWAETTRVIKQALDFRK